MKNTIIFDESKIVNSEKWLKIIILLKNMKDRESYADQKYIFLMLLASLVVKIWTDEIYEKLNNYSKNNYLFSWTYYLT